MKPVYLDNNATTRVDPEVLSAMLPYFSEHFGNPSSAHGFGVTVAEAIKAARARVLRLIGAASDQEIVFTSGGTEADNTAIRSLFDVAVQAGATPAEAGGPPPRDEVVTTTVEHPAVLAACKHLSDTRGIKVHLIPVDAAGNLDIEAYRAALGPRTALVSVMWANNETGVVFPIAQLAAWAHEVGALFHTDAVQGVGKAHINIAETEVDLLSLSGHKFHAPKGVGALYVRKGLRLRPWLRGGHQERGRRAGTENTTGIVGLGKAAELAIQTADQHVRIEGQRNRLERALVSRIDGARIVGLGSPRVANTSNIAFEDVESEAVLVNLGRAGIAASSGSACASGSMEPSHVLRAMNVPLRAIHGAVRFSLSRYTEDAEIDRVIEVLPGIIAKLRS